MKAAFRNFVFFALALTAFSCRNSAEFDDNHSQAAVCTVTFNLSGQGENFSQKVLAGEKAVEPKVPECEGFAFDSWFCDREFAQKFDFNVPIESDVEIFAKWTALAEDQIALTFCKNAESQERVVLIVQKNAPFFMGANFFDEKLCVEKWLDENKKEYDVNALVESGFGENKNFYASWTGKTFSVEFYEGETKKNLAQYKFSASDAAKIPVVAVSAKRGCILDEENSEILGSQGGNPVLKEKNLEIPAGTWGNLRVNLKKKVSALTFTAKEAAVDIAFKMTGNVTGILLWQTKDDPLSENPQWQPYKFGEMISLNPDEKSHFAGRCNLAFYQDDENYIRFFTDAGWSTLGKIEAEGSIMSLVDECGETREIPCENMFQDLFYTCRGLTKAPELSATKLQAGCYRKMFYVCQNLESAPALPAEILAENCYEKMFYGCMALKDAPELPAKNLAPFCYREMFYACEGLENAPALPAENLAKNCYSNMFNGCKALAEAPALPATTLAPFCYQEMFSGCKSLKSAPELPAKNLAEKCYSSMFSSCQFSEAPALPAETLAPFCYEWMFSHCENLQNAPELPAENLTEGCYANMFWACGNLSRAPELKAKVLKKACFKNMFFSCGKIDEIKVEFESWNDDEGEVATSSWLDGAAASGKFFCPAALSAETRDASHIPAGWEVKTE